MLKTKHSQREFLLSLWARNRLGERETVEWAVQALSKIRGALGTDATQLFEILSDEASRADLPLPLKTLWRLFNKAARESAFLSDFGLVYDFKQKLQQRSVLREDIDDLIAWLRPRLKAKPYRHWRVDQDGSETDNPIDWVGWEFETALHSSYQRDARPKRNELSSLSPELLARLLERGTVALKDAMEDAREIGWIREGRDLPNLFVHRVFIAEGELKDEDEDVFDPDDSNNDLVPIVRLLAEAFEALRQQDVSKCRSISNGWAGEPTGLFQRLFAMSAWFPEVQDGASVARFLRDLSDEPFWRWQSYPEIATLRAQRWADIPVELRLEVAQRLYAGPAARKEEESDIEATSVAHHMRDHELARIVDGGRAVPSGFHELVLTRRQSDPAFPRAVPSIERGLSGTTVSWASDGSPDAFKDVPTASLLHQLTQSGSGRFGERHDAEAFAQTTDGKRRIIEALALGADERTTVAAWKILLSYSHVKDDDTKRDRATIEEIASLALSLTREQFGQIADELCYWIDAADERLPKFSGSEPLWFALLPLASQKAQSEHANDANRTATDLTSEALNEPLGHLLSWFLRRCPTIPAKGKHPPLPEGYVAALKQLGGRARELLANRMAVQMNYFARADIAWLREEVLTPMSADTPVSDRLWEAFTKYSRVPPPAVWQKIDDLCFKRLASASLSPEARRRLAEMSAVIWFWSKQDGSGYNVDTARMRTAFALGNEDVRGALAWQFSTIIRGKPDSGEPDGSSHWRRFGPAFFREVWPLEPILQSAKSANDFARIPGRLDPSVFAESVRTILPYLLPFEVWSVSSEFGLDAKDEGTRAIVQTSPNEVIALLAACISERQPHRVFDLGSLLDLIRETDPDLRRDTRMRSLRKMAHNA